jgi:hypothetical protein
MIAALSGSITASPPPEKAADQNYTGQTREPLLKPYSWAL